MSKLIVAVLTLLLGPAIANATEIYTVTEVGVVGAAATQFSFTEPTILAIGDTTSITQISGAVVTDFSWNSAGLCPSFVGGFRTGADACITYQSGSGLIDNFVSGSFLTDGTYTSLGGDETVMISGNPGATPEPSTVVLFVTGLVILVSRRNR
jgi:hypothetical protein